MTVASSAVHHVDDSNVTGVDLVPEEIGDSDLVLMDHVIIYQALHEPIYTLDGRAINGLSLAFHLFRKDSIHVSCIGACLSG